MRNINQPNTFNLRLLAEVGASGVLAFIIVSVVLSATSPAPMSLAYMLTLS
jgi:hypothetical protein